MFLLYRFRSTCVTNAGNSLRRRATSLDTWKPTSNRLKPIPVMCVGRSLRGQTTENATRNPTTTRLTVPFVVNILIEGKACSVTGLSTKVLKWGQWGRDLHPLDHPIVIQSNHEVTLPSLPTVRLSVNHLSEMNPKSSQKTRRTVSYISDTGIPSYRGDDRQSYPGQV
jgi:hypothetical protein